MSSEITVTIKGIESTYKHKFLVYEEFKWTPDDPFIKKCVEEALNISKIIPENIKVRGLIQFS